MNRYFEILKQDVISGGQVQSGKSWFFIFFAFILGGVLVGEPVFTLVLIGLGGFAVLIPSIVLSVSVLNDANRSGWWLLISFIPLIGSTVLLGFVAQDSRSKENQGGCDSKATTA